LGELSHSIARVEADAQGIRADHLDHRHQIDHVEVGVIFDRQPQPVRLRLRRQLAQEGVSRSRRSRTPCA
jgi:hypothetical protein